MKHVISLLFLILLSSGCASNQPYDPLMSASRQTYLLNESSLAQITNGMSKTQVYKVMGETIIVGYTSSKPMTINNPYKTEDIQVKESTYTVEYYVSRINQPDGVVTNDELTPVVFHDGIVIGKGWNYLKSLR